MPVNFMTHLTFFGDSLTDMGVMSGLTSRNLIVTVPVPGAGYGRSFSNGPVYAEVMAEMLSASGDLGASSGLAVGGAHAVGEMTFADYVDARVGAGLPEGAIYRADADPADLASVLDLQGQVARYLASGAAPGGAVAINIGLNDYAEFTPTSPETALAEGAALVGGVLRSTTEAALAAVGAGASQVILCDLPDFRFFPLSTTRPEAQLALGDQLLAGHNQGIAALAAGLGAAGVEAVVLDMNRISAEIAADPATYGFRPDLMSQPALLGTGGNPTLVAQPDGGYRAVFPANPAVAGVDPDQIAFWDLVHPSAALHGVWGAFSAESLRSETLFRGDGDDRIGGSASADLVLAGAGADRIAARGGADVVLAGLGADRVAGGGGADILAGGAGRDALLGGAGADVLADGAGCDLARGGSGEDLLLDGAGFDRLFGGRGDDGFVYMAGTLRGSVLAGNGGVMRGGAGCDTAYLVLDAETRAAVAAELVPHAANQTLRSLGLTLIGMESVVLLGPDDLGAIASSARLEEADLWGLI